MDAHHVAVALDGDIDVDGDVNVAVVLDADGLDDDRFLRQFDGRELRQGREQLLRRRVVSQFYFGVGIKGLPPGGTTYTPPWTKPSPTKLPFVPSERLMFFLRREKGLSIFGEERLAIVFLLALPPPRAS